MPATASTSAAAVIPQARMTLSSSRSFALETGATEAVLISAAKAGSRVRCDLDLHAPAAGDRGAALEIVAAGLARGRILPANREVAQCAAQGGHQVSVSGGVGADSTPTYAIAILSPMSEYASREITRRETLKLIGMS